MCKEYNRAPLLTNRPRVKDGLSRAMPGQFYRKKRLFDFSSLPLYLIRRIMIFATGLRQSRRAGIKFPIP